MTRKLFKTRKGQISTEIMYAVGVMILLFLLLTGITLNRRVELRKTDDYLQKRNDCLKISNVISTLSASGFNTQTSLTPYYLTRVYKNSRIVVDFDPASKKETPCTYVGAVKISGADYVDLQGSSTYLFKNDDGQITITLQ